MKTLFKTTILLFFYQIQFSQVIVTESFEATMSAGLNQGDCGCINLPDQFSDGTNDYYGRQNNGTISANGGSDYSNFVGSNYFAGEDHDASDCNSPCTPTLSFIMTNIVVPNPTDNRTYQISFFAGGNSDNGSYDNIGDIDFVTVEYSLNDQASFIPLVCFTTTATPLNVLSEDADCVQPGEGINNLSQAMQSFSGTFNAQNPTNNRVHIRVTANSGGSNEEWAIDHIVLSDLGIVLPIEMRYFYAKSERNMVQLNWETASETKNQGFDIQRSLDGINWEKIGWEAGIGNSADQVGYAFIDQKPNFENYYRLKQIDFDGNATYSKVIHVNLDPISTINVFPNPVKDLLNIEGISDTNAVVEIFNNLGQRVLSQTVYSKVINLSQLNSGIYWMKIITEAEFISVKIIKE